MLLDLRYFALAQTNFAVNKEYVAKKLHFSFGCVSSVGTPAPHMMCDV